MNETAMLDCGWRRRPGGEALIERAVRSTERSDEKEAARCYKAWRMADGHRRLSCHLRRAAKRRCDAHAAQAGRQMAPFSAAERTAALVRPDSEIDPGEVNEPGGVE